MKQACTFSIQGMHCTSCAMNIDGELEDTPGVFSAETNYAKQSTTVTYDAEEITEQKLQQIIVSLGYDALLQSKKSIE